MPHFTTKPSAVEAHQWVGNLASLPLEFAAVVEPRGRFDPIVRTYRGAMDLPEMHWLVRAPDGRFEVMSPSAFDAWFQPQNADSPAPDLEEEVHHDGTGRRQAGTRRASRAVA